MSVEIEFSQLTKVIWYDEIVAQYPNFIDNLKRDLAKYIETNGDELPDYFGKDDLYTFPRSIMTESVRHIHLKIPPDVFNSRRRQIDRKCKIGEFDKDIALVYVISKYNPNKASILAILNGNAHKLAQDEKLMLQIKEAARVFHIQTDDLR